MQSLQLIIMRHLNKTVLNIAAVDSIDMFCLYIIDVAVLCACEDWSKDNARKQQLDKDRYFHSILRVYQPSQGWSHVTAQWSEHVYMFMCCYINCIFIISVQSLYIYDRSLYSCIVVV